jgi:hypothetical protein
MDDQGKVVEVVGDVPMLGWEHAPAQGQRLAEERRRGRVVATHPPRLGLGVEAAGQGGRWGAEPPAQGYRLAGQRVGRVVVGSHLPATVVRRG